MVRTLSKVLFLLIFSTGYSCGECASESSVQSDGATQEEAGPIKLGSQPITKNWEEVDPYCGMKIKRSEAATSFVHKGRTYYFCLVDHKEAFARDPDRYLAPPEAEGDAYLIEESRFNEEPN